MKYPLVEKLGLPLCRDQAGNEIVYSHELEEVLKQAIVVYGQKIDQHYFDETQNEDDTHTALLINIQPIKEKTTLQKISEIINKEHIYFPDAFKEIKKLIEEENEAR